MTGVGCWSEDSRELNPLAHRAETLEEHPVLQTFAASESNHVGSFVRNGTLN